ncbi:MAG TPA: TIGR00282 family metallophosphoesterase [Phycisphaerae bacterium]|nr:TIGR00282 family metallophosphoesterase [Phycisphaerae bacterium]HRY66927.1 TIGR00282 family metallophosphoesterase [Phycisphaerae bacterium]HSA27875.1 TIGR00282 family metallophosphoesterase [Phycisphaerae bacterium]
MRVNLLCIGDVVGRPGRYAISQTLPHLAREYNIHCVIANAENAAGGSGLTPQLFEKFRRYGVDLITLGDHIYRRQEIIPVLESSDRIVRPANMSPQAVGRNVAICQTKLGPKVAIISLLGRLFMKTMVDCPFHAVDRVLKQLPPDVKIVVVDVHAEATSEKVAMGWYLDGRVSAVVGTHTHVQTADESILPNGTAYLTDLGMTGPFDSVLGRLKDRVIRTFLTNLPHAFDVAEGDPRLCGLLVGVESTTGKAEHVERICIDKSSPLFVNLAGGEVD